MISIIAAIGKNNELGKNNKLLWSLPADMAHFKKLTTGHTIIMGQKTFESIGKPLPNRKNIVLSLDKNSKPNGVEITNSIEKAIKMSRTALDTKNKEVFVIGGGQIYKLFMNIANKLYITHINASFPDADTFFPEIDLNKSQKIKSKIYKKDENNIYNLEFAEYIKK